MADYVNTLMNIRRLYKQEMSLSAAKLSINESKMELIMNF
jgi:hypothetical protein